MLQRYVGLRHRKHQSIFVNLKQNYHRTVVHKLKESGECKNCSLIAIDRLGFVDDIYAAAAFAGTDELDFVGYATQQFLTMGYDAHPALALVGKL